MTCANTYYEPNTPDPEPPVPPTPAPSDGEVVSEKLKYDNLTSAKKAEDNNAAIALTSNNSKKATESVVSAFSADVAEANERSSASSKAFISNEFTDTSKKSTATSAIAGAVLTDSKKATDKTGLEIAAPEEVKKSIAKVELDIFTQNTGKRATSSNVIRFDPSVNIGKKSTTSNSIEAAYVGYVNQIASSSGYSPAGNVIGDTDEFALITAVADGILGGNSRTTTGEMVLDFKDPTSIIGDLSVQGNVSIEIEREITLDGLTLSLRSYVVIYQYKTTGGYIEFARDEGTINVPRAFATISLPNVTLSDIDDLQVKVIGSVTSGTGVDSRSTSRIYSSKVVFDSGKEY